MSTAQIRAIEDYIQLTNRNAISHVIRAAVNLGIIRELAQGQRTLEQLAAAENLNRESLQLLMNVLCETELVEKYGDDYALSAVARLIPDQQHDLGDHYWQYLTGVIRSGVRLPADNEIPVSDRDFLLNWTADQWTHTPAALDAAEVLEAGTTRKGIRILELGCGAAVFGATLAHRDPESRLVLVDNASAIEKAAKTVESIELKSRCEMIVADYADPNIVEILDNDTFDLVVIAGLLHRHQKEDCRQLIQRFSQLVKVDGEMAIIDVFEGQEKGDRTRTVFELELFLRTSRGTLHNPTDVEAYMKEGGLSQIRFAHLPAPPHVWGLLLGKRTG